jgi:DNA polymerase I
MIELDRLQTSGELPGRLLMQVHDELVCECSNADGAALAAGMERAMTGILSLSGITLTVDVHIGSNWAEAKS